MTNSLNTKSLNTKSLSSKIRDISLDLLTRESEHSYRIESDEARLLIVVAPAGLEGYYRELHQPVAHESAQPEIERVVTLAARFGLTITGPGS